MPAPETLLPAPPLSTAEMARERDNARGAAWMLMSVVTASVMTLAVRWSSEEMDSRMIVMLRSVGGLGLAMIAFALVPRLRGALRITAPWLHVWRGGLIGVSTQLGFYTITQLPLATATVLFFTAPIFTTLLAIPLQGETVGLRRALAIGAGFLGVLIVMRPAAAGAAEGFDFAMLTALASSLLFALALLSSRGLANRDGPFAAYVSSVVMTIIVSVPIAAPVWSAGAPLLPVSAIGWSALGLVVVTSLARNIGDLQAYRWAEASVLAPLAYLRLILIAGAGYVFFSETPDAWTVTGGAVIVAAALYIAHRERLVRRG